jgi:hypothetical protein
MYKGILSEFWDNYLISDNFFFIGRKNDKSFENLPISLLPQITVKYLSRAAKRIK